MTRTRSLLRYGVAFLQCAAVFFSAGLPAHALEAQCFSSVTSPATDSRETNHGKVFEAPPMAKRSVREHMGAEVDATIALGDFSRWGRQGSQASPGDLPAGSGAATHGWSADSSRLDFGNNHTNPPDDAFALVGTRGAAAFGRRTGKPRNVEPPEDTPPSKTWVPWLDYKRLDDSAHDVVRNTLADAPQAQGVRNGKIWTVSLLVIAYFLLLASMCALCGATRSKLERSHQAGIPMDPAEGSAPVKRDADVERFDAAA